MIGGVKEVGLLCWKSITLQPPEQRASWHDRLTPSSYALASIPAFSKGAAFTGGLSMCFEEADEGETDGRTKRDGRRGRG